MDTIKAFLSNEIVLLSVMAIIIITISLLLFFKFRNFAENRRYIIMEMNRSSKREKRHWEYQLKKLYVSQIPLIGGFLSRFVNKK